MSNLMYSAVLRGAMVLVALGGLTAARASTITVPGQKLTIQAAIDAASNGDMILVSPGTYKENINFNGKAIRVTSVSGPSVTIIDGNAADSVVAFVSGEGSGSIIDGFTVRNGLSTFSTRGFGDGGGILIQGSSPTINNNIISNNRGCDGLGISIFGGAPTIKGNMITANTRTGCSGGVGGGGIEVLGGQGAQIMNNIISNNSLGAADGGGISIFAGGDVLVSGNFIADNSVTGISPGTEGGGIWIVNGSSPIIVNNVIVGNHADFGGGVFWLVPSGSHPMLINNTIVANDSREGSAVHANSFDGLDLIINNILVAPSGQSALFCDNFNTSKTPMIKSNDVFTPGGGSYGGICTDQTGINHNISVDPGFVNPVNRDYHLLPGSPSIDAGDNSAPNLPPTDFDGKPRIQDGKGTGTPIIDLGAFEFSRPPAVFDMCLKDDSSGNILQFNSSTGAYKFTRCSDQFSIVGQGTVRSLGSIISLTDSKADRKISAGLLVGQRTGSATIYFQIAPGVWQIFRISATNPAAVCSCGS